ncbi:MAG: signal peptidase I [Clostridia bacterium]|nr:signal peptidase I [Clostridia bacterium]
MKKESAEVVQTKGSKKKLTGKKKVFSIIGNVLMWLFIVIAVVITIFAFSAQSNSDGIPTVGGKVISPVLSESMAPTINKGDIILSRKLADNEKTGLAVGTIISFKADLDGDGSPEINTHRIIDIIDGEYKTQGDNNEFADNYNVNPTDVISVFDPEKDTKIPVLGNVINFLLQPTGFFFVIVIPLIVFFLFEIIMFVRKLIEVKNSDKKQITAADEELIKKKAIEEYLRQQNLENEQKSVETPQKEPEEEPAEEPAEAPVEEPAEEAEKEEKPE